MKPGIDALRAKAHLVRGRAIGLLTNPTGVSADLRPTAEVLIESGDPARRAVRAGARV